MKFSSAELALDWAEKVWSMRLGGRTTFREEFGGESGVPKDYMILDAIQIRGLATRACRWGHPCPYAVYQCLQAELVPDPLVFRAELPKTHKDRIDDCVAEFTRLLRGKGFLEG
jgi:hypothetical protein